MSFFHSLPLLPPDLIFGLNSAYQQDPHPHKIKVLIVFYKNVELKTPVMHAVKAAEKRLLEKETTKEYLPLDGDPLFLEEVKKLIFSEKCPLFLYGAQSVGGTGALRILGEFLHKTLFREIYIPELSWPVHETLFTKAGFIVEKYPYYNRGTNQVDFDRIYSFFTSLPEKSCIVLHAACHNPTGVDFSKKEWEELSSLFLIKGFFAFFDAAYQGFHKGLSEDCFAIRLFLEKGIECAVASSFSKNFSLYGERTGALFIATKEKGSLSSIASQIKVLIRCSYSNPPRHGAAIVREILLDSFLKKSWEEELKGMRERIAKMRRDLAKAFSIKLQKDLTYLAEGAGLFAFTGLNSTQVESLQKRGIYMTLDGRMNVTSCNEQNMDIFVNAVGDALL